MATQIWSYSAVNLAEMMFCVAARSLSLHSVAHVLPVHCMYDTRMQLTQANHDLSEELEKVKGEGRRTFVLRHP